MDEMQGRIERFSEKSYRCVYLGQIQFRQRLVHEKVGFQAVRHSFEGDIFFQIDANVVGFALLVDINTLGRGC